MNRFAKVISLCSLAAACGPPDYIDPGAPGDEAGAVQLPPEAIAAMEGLLAEKAARTPVQKKIDSQLLYAKSGRFATGDVKDPSQQIHSRMQTDDLGRVLVDIKGDLTAMQARVEALGGSVVTTSPAHASMRAWLDLAEIENLAAFAEVRTVRTAMTARTSRADDPHAKQQLTRAERIASVQAASETWTSSILTSLVPGDATTNAGAAQSEGSRAMAVDRSRKAFGTDGTGVKVGVLSDSDDFKEASIASGDLGADTVTIPGQDGRPGSGEGTAMMQIVHDLAPGAQLFFATAFTSPESFAENIRTLRFTYHCDVIVDDIIYYFESPYQDDIIAQAVADVVADGALYFSSAGNDGHFDDGTSGTWEGDFKSGGAFNVLPSGYTVHDFGSRVIWNRIEVGGGPAFLHWADPGTLDNGQSSNDYDIFILTPDMRSVAAASTDIQDGDDIPFEFLDFDIPADYRLVVAQKPGATNRAIRMVISNGELGLSTSGAVWGHNSAPGAFAVAAVDVAEASGGEFTGGATTQPELFSSDGNRRIFYDRFGAPLTPGSAAGTFQCGAGENRQKPDIAGADGVSTTLPSGSGLNPFFGTSAAAPHVAAIAALIRAAVPTASANKIRSALLSGATDIGALGTDRDSGRGVSNAFLSLQKANAKPAVFLEEGTVTVTPVGSGAIVPGGSGTVTIQLLNNGLATATHVSATLTALGVTVTTGASAYPDLAAGASAVNTTPFAFDVPITTACGAKIPVFLTVTYTGNGTKPISFAASIQTGAPSGVVSTFSFTGPRALIPDGNAAGVNISVPVSGVGTVARVTFVIDGGPTCSTATGSATAGLDHSWVGDLVATLRSPSGTAVTLFSRPGGTENSGNNFCKTLFTDSAVNSIQNITSAGAPYSGTFKPASPLSGFAGDNGDGNWTLNVADLVSIDTGSVRAFSIDVSGFTCVP